MQHSLPATTESSIVPELLIYILVFLVFLVVLALSIKYSRSKNRLLPTDWPIVGILPSLVQNLHRFHDYITVLLATSRHGFKPPVARSQFFATCDPANVWHIFTSNHANYPKGEDFAEIFDVVSGSIFNAAGESCRRQHARYQGVLCSQRLLASMTECCRDKVENGLVPFLTNIARTRTPLDMKDLLTRFVFDLYATKIFSVDRGCLSLDIPPVHVADTMDTVMEVGFIRLNVSGDKTPEDRPREEARCCASCALLLHQRNDHAEEEDQPNYGSSTMPG